jgi:general secretion pathway protein K
MRIRCGGEGTVMARWQRERRGLALVSVLWAMALLALLATAQGRRASTAAQLARNLIDATHAEELADAGVRLAALQLVRGASMPGEPMALRLGDGMAVVRIEDERGRIDLGHAPIELIEQLLLVVGLDPARARLGAQAIGEARELQPPVDLSLLRRLGPLDAATALRLEHALTVFSGEDGVATEAAGADVRAALELDAPVQAEADELDERLVAEPGRVLRIISEGRLEGGAAFTRRAVIMLTGRFDVPVRLLVWERG